MGLFDQSKTMIILQIVAAIIITIVLYIITLVVLNIDSIVVNNSIKVLPKQHTKIITGYAPASYLAKKTFNTVNPLSDNFVKIGKSINTSGGSQFSYQLWIKLDDPEDANYKDLILLLKGDARKYKLAKYTYEKNASREHNIDCDTVRGYNVPEVICTCNEGEKRGNNGTVSCSTFCLGAWNGGPKGKCITGLDTALLNSKEKNSKISEFDPEYVINCPMIKFGNSSRELLVYFNTGKGPIPISLKGHLTPNVKIEMSKNTESIAHRNVLSLLPVNWFLLTFVIEDNYSVSDGAENGIKFILYVNDFPYQIASGSTDMFLRNNMLKQNDGNLTLLPNLKGSGDFMKLGNISYYNYALTAHDVHNAYKRGPPTFSAVDQDNKAKTPAYLSAYNKIDIYNA